MAMTAVNIAFPCKGALCVFDVVHIFTLKKRTISLLPPGTTEGENENPLPAWDFFISHSMMFDFFHMLLSYVPIIDAYGLDLIPLGVSF